MKRFFSIALSCLLAVAASAQNVSVGIIASYSDLETGFKTVKEAGMKAFQTGYSLSWDENTAKQIKKLTAKYDVHISALCYIPSNARWNFSEGPSTIGLVPPMNRLLYLDNYKKTVDFCAMAGIPALHSHFGFIPENPADELYVGFIETMRDLCQYAKDRGVMVYCETGQETPVALIRAIRDIGTGNVFVNCDTANLILYGKANPVDAVYQFGPLLKEMHIKDGKYPTDPYYLGHETKIPEGDVDFPRLFKALKDVGFKGILTIECELSGDNSEYIAKTKKYLEGLAAEVGL